MDGVSIRGDWVGQLIDGKFPLLEWLGGSGGQGVFATELDGHQAAIKLIPVSVRAEDRLTVWSSASSLSHPHLLRILDFGRAEINDTRFVYVVTDLASEVLSQIIPERPLTTDEAREMLGPIISVLEYLHLHGYSHSHLEPSNILVVDNEIKVSSDRLLNLGSAASELPINDVHVAPELAGDPVTASADTWSLGITLVETLTQEAPIWDAAGNTDPVVPATVPEPFFSIARECLHPDPTRRCSLADVRAMLEVKPPPPEEPGEPLHLPHHQHRLADKSLPSKMPLVPLIIGFVLLVAIIIGLEIRSHKTQTAPLQTESTQQAPAAEPESQPPAPQSTAPVPNPATPEPPTAGSTPGDVLSRVVPDVPRSARATIHGTVSVAVRVNVDATGSVSNAEFASRGPSAYFARLAIESARNWKFKPLQQDGRDVPSTWLLHYKFRRDGVEVTPESAGGK